MDNKFQLFGVKFGVDPILDIIPGFGNIFGVILSSYLFWIAYHLNVPKSVYAKMAKNIGLDFLLGAVPFAGVVFDLLYKANVKNLALLEPFLEEGVVLKD